MTDRDQGFTLVEVLVVMVIMAVLAASVVLGFVGADREQNLRTEAERLVALIELARTEALSRNEEWGLTIEGDGYSFLVYDPDRDRWQAAEDTTFRSRDVPDVKLAVTLNALKVPEDDKRRSERPAILILSSGEQTPFDVEFIPGWATRSWIVSSDGISRTTATRAP
jgi:general secretion pathway protein H